jgi:predicted ATPase
MHTHTNWHVITGGPGSGKTALITMLSRLGYATVPEAAREIIDEGLARGMTLAEIRGDEQAWQAKILQRILDTEATIDPKVVTFFDRGAHDGMAHLRYYQQTPPATWDTVMKGQPYRTVFLLDPLPSFEKDYARTENAAFIERINGIMADVYNETGMKVIRVPFVSPEERLALILTGLGLPDAKEDVSAFYGRSVEN